MGNVPNLRFPEFSGEWENCQIANILSIGSGRDYKHLEKGNIPVFGTGGYMTSVNECIYDGETTFIGRKGSINKPFYYNGKFWTVDTLFYTHSFNKTTPKFVYCLFQTINWLRYNEASGVPSLSKDTIEKIKVFIPQLDEQRKISEMLSVIDERIATQNKIIMERGYIKITEEEIGKPIVEVKIVNGTVWMFKHEIARLFDVHLQTVGNNFRSIFKSGVLHEDDVTMERKMKNEKGQDIYVTFYNLEAIIFLSYRIDSRYAKAFREWVMNALCEYNRMDKKATEVIVVFNADTRHASIQYPQIPN